MRVRSITAVKKLAGQRILLRVDCNVPLAKGKVKDDFKIRQSLPTIKYLLERGARVIIVSHLGRPVGVDVKLSLKPIADSLSAALGKKIPLIKIGGAVPWKTVAPKCALAQDGQAVLLENIRFVPGEEKNTAAFSRQLAALADLFVLDGFAVAHRAAASVSGVAKYLPAYAGLLLAEEIFVISKIASKPKPPLVVLLGGAKVETKIPVLESLLKKAAHILVGGGIVNTYLWATGNNVGQSLVGKEYKRKILRAAASKKIIWPVDVVVGRADGAGARVMSVDKKSLIKKKFRIAPDEAIYDIGPETVRRFAGYIKKAQTLFWNGAMGKFEQHPYEYGTYALAELFAARSRGQAYGVAGGGETVAVLKARHLFHQVDFVSTGGGALLEYLAGKKLPGLKALEI